MSRLRHGELMVPAASCSSFLCLSRSHKDVCLPQDLNVDGRSRLGEKQGVVSVGGGLAPINTWFKTQRMFSLEHFSNFVILEITRTHRAAKLTENPPQYPVRGEIGRSSHVFRFILTLGSKACFPLTLTQ